MIRSGTEPTEQERLRQEAEACIREGTSPPSRGCAVGTDALTRLYHLASDPRRGADALQVLQELQAHQVELDLQHAQHTESQRDLIHDLAHYKSLYESAPMGYVVVSLDGWIIECNRAGADLFGAEPGDLGGQRVGSVLALESRPAFGGLLRDLRTGSRCVSGELRTGPDAATGRVLWVSATVAPAGDAVLMTVFERGACEQV